MSRSRPHREAWRARGDGGVPARRAVARWAWRLFRREWRQQILVLALLTVAVAATIVSASVAHNLAPAQGNAEFGAVDHFLRFDSPDPQTLAADVAAALAWFGAIDVITHRSVPVPGAVDSIEYRTQDPNGAFGGPMLALRDGRYPTGNGEVAVTDGVAGTFGLEIGSSFALDGVARTVVGVVENPSDLDGEFTLGVASPTDSPDSVTILIGGSFDRLASFRPPSGTSAMAVSSRAGNEDVVAAMGVLGVAAVALLLVALVAAASFVVMARRRLRQLGMLAAIGATEKHLRLVMVANGAVVGIAAAAFGGALGLVVWIAAVPVLEPAVGHRIEWSNVPWWLIGTSMLLAVASATGAAWWPARAVARTPITLALSGRPGTVARARRPAALAGMLIVIGLVCLAVRDQTVMGETDVDWTSALLLVAGTVTTALGMLLVGPLAIRAVAAPARWLPIAVRLALRDLDRYQARSGAALAAISLVLGISAAIVIGAAAAEETDAEGNLSDRQLMIWTSNAGDPQGVSPFYTEDPGDDGFSPFVPELTAADVANLEVRVDRIATLFDTATVTALDVAVDPAVAREPGFGGRPAVVLARRDGDGYRDVALLYVATARMLAHYGLDLDAVDPETEVLTVETGELRLVGVAGVRGVPPEAVTGVVRITPTYSSLAGSFVTSEALRRRGWESTRVGWLVETNQPLTSEQLAAARDVATDTGLLIEGRRAQANLAPLRSGATVAGMLVALGLLAMTVGLIRSETGGDLRTLAAAGATSAIRRTLTAATAGALAFMGAALGTVGAYVALFVGYRRDIGDPTAAPIRHLLFIVVGVPLLATLAGWLLAGREPRALVRRSIE